MSTTEQYPDFSGYTFEKVWASNQESRQELNLYLRKSYEDAQREIQELREQMKEANLRMKEELRVQTEKTDRQIKETNRIIGRLGNRYSELMESLVRPGVAKKFNKLGYSFDGESHNLIYLSTKIYG